MEKQKTHLTEHQTLLLEMLHDFDQVCRNHNIHYQLFAGTALGAVRHGGFIPWDDDIDVILMRDEYERFFREAAGDFDPSVYYVQKDNSPHWPMQFSKLRRNGTACMEKYHPKDKLVHQGVYIDIFPCDNLANGGLIRRLQFAASKVVIAKALYARGYETNSIAKKLFMQFCRIVPRRPLEEFCIRRKDAGTEWYIPFWQLPKAIKRTFCPGNGSTTQWKSNLRISRSRSHGIMTLFCEIYMEITIGFPLQRSVNVRNMPQFWT